MTTPFRLFSLPYIPLKQVLDNIGPEALIILSMCSRRSKRIAVSYRGPSKSVKLIVRFGGWYCVSCTEGAGLYVFLNVVNQSKLSYVNQNLATVRIGNFCNIPAEMRELGLNTYWEDRMVGVTQMGNYAREVFNQDIYEVCIFNKQEDDDHRRAAEWVKNSQKTIQSLHCNFNPKSDKELDFILENFKFTEKLFLCVKPSEHFRPAKLPNFNVDFVYIIFSCWIKQDHLLAMNCKVITLEASKLTSREFNIFLKHWMAGGCFQLKELRVFVDESIDYEVVLDGVEFTGRERYLERVFVDEDRNHHTIRGGFDVKRLNVTATVVDVQTLFWMIVW